MPPVEAFVLRFPPGGIDMARKMKDEARYTNSHHRRQCQQRGEEPKPWHRLSCWVSPALAGESRDEVLLRLVHDAGLGRISIEDVRNNSFWWSTVGRVEEAGFVFVKDGDDGEPVSHYSVDLGDNPSIERVKEFAATFEGPVETKGYTQ